ncbi:succinate-semialdehyde dehdyrogenase [Sulfuricella sp. T08]|uniref:NAD-dependent succinate-semialdehyde dehydrogenase n=1 Tax=Sulfuricella sp. T08 TaxID=1632857 RepID=UPI0006179E3F|nr:NAD-dependent succinate-semialdehyde dehydrogenase [Sulfuricella sp. T08]GAO35267.1 succinate-semialdehyde dehdyrogenase [Sulfuricella sp. T08]
MPHISLNPATGKVERFFQRCDDRHLDSALEEGQKAQKIWRITGLEQRAEALLHVAEILMANHDDYAALITREMGKPLREARAEVEKCALACDYYAHHAGELLTDEPIETDATRSYVSYPPLGTVLAIMPWNFPFWQVFRAAAPALMAGNAILLKHSSNVPQCALAVEDIFRTAGLPHGLFATLMIDASQVAGIIADPRIHAVTFTGSEPAGRQVAAEAGRNLKKCVLELGGSDPFIILHDADLDYTSTQAVNSRFLNNGQSCIAAKRFIVVPEIADEFMLLMMQKVAALRVGDPMKEDTQMGPMARLDLRDELHRQVADSITQGAQALLGCEPVAGEGAYYLPSILDHVTPKARAYHEELFGPVAAVIRAHDEQDALRIANDTRFGLGASLWSGDAARAERLSREIGAGCCFINGMVKSDPRLPFGGIKASGYGRELSYHGIREFVNIKTVWVK